MVLYLARTCTIVDLKGSFHMTILFGILHLLSAVFLIAVILLQSGKTPGLSGALAGGSDTFLAKNKGRTLDARLARITKYVAIVFAVITLVINFTI